MVLLCLEYLMMLYYAARLADFKTFTNIFSGIESFLDVGTNEFGKQIYKNDSIDLTPSAQNKASAHIYINCVFFGIYLLGNAAFASQIFKINSYEKTKESSYIMKSISLFMVLTITILQTPIIVSCFVVLKIIILQLAPNLFILACIIILLLILNFTFTVIFSLKFFNLEVPNEEIVWSFNQTGGIYFKVLLKIILCSQELYREQLNQRGVAISVLLIVTALLSLILLYRINTPNIFNSTVHNFTLMLESCFFTLAVIGMISILTDRNILTTLTYLFIFIPIMVKIIFSADQQRKHQVLYKLKNENALSKNEYLIALTHLLKMIKRQSETDLAQLMSFTYQHKITCYSKNCICQFFTQYCQDPQMFKKKKRRMYQGYRDDGQKLIQIIKGDGSMKEFLEEQIQQMSLVDEQSSMNQGQSVMGDSSYVLENTYNNMLNSESNFIGGANEDQSRNTLENIMRPEDLLQSNQNNINFNKDNQNNNNDVYMSMKMMGDDQNNPDVQINEPNIMGLFSKGYILRGAAYNGFDTNMDFKIKETLFKELEKKTSSNMSFSLISIYFQYSYQHNIYQAVFAIVKSAQNQKRSYIERLRFSITEFYLLDQILQEIKINNSKDEVNYTTFIESNQMQQNLDWLFEETSGEVMQFWNIFKEEQANVRKAYVLGLSISKSIGLIKQYTRQLEENQLIKDYNKYYYYAMFYQNILNDKSNYNLMINNLKNLLMVRNIRKKNSRFGLAADMNDIGFAIMSFEDDKVVGRFKYANRVICQILNTSEEAIIDKSAKHLMPELIGKNHHLFIKRFIQDGLPRFIGRVRTIFIRDFKQYLRPVQFFINFHYNSKFSYSVIMHIDPVQTLNFLNHQVIPIKHALIFSTDEHNNIKDISYNCKKLIGLSRKQLRVQEEIMGRKLKMEDIIHQMAKLDQYITENSNLFLTNQIVKVRAFQNGDQNYVTCSLSFEEIVYLKDNFGEFRERIYILIPVSKIPEYDNTSVVSSRMNQNYSGNFQGNSNSETLENGIQQFWASSEFTNSIERSQGILDQDRFMSASVSASSKSSSTITSSSSLSYTKGLLFQQKSPKILKIYLYIVFGVMFSFITVSSINFIIYMQKKNEVNLQIQFNDLINKRNTCLISTLSSLKQLHIITTMNNPSIFNVSSIFPQVDRYNYYSKKVTSSSLQLLSLLEQYMSLQNMNPSIGQTSNQSLFENVQLMYLSRNFQEYNQTNSFDYGLSLLVSNIGMITPANLQQEKIPINIESFIAQSLIKISKQPQFTASDDLRNLYYVFTNGMNQLNLLGHLQEQNIQTNTIQTSNNSKLYINLMSFISMGVITLIGIFTFPLLGKIQDRKISVLKFFNLLNLDQINTQIERGKEFQDEFNMLSKDVNQNKEDNSDNQDEDYEDEYDSEDEDYTENVQQMDKNQGLQFEKISYNNIPMIKSQLLTFNAPIPERFEEVKFQELNADLADIINQDVPGLPYSHKNWEKQTIDPDESKSEVLKSKQILGPDSNKFLDKEKIFIENNNKNRVKFAPEDLMINPDPKNPGFEGKKFKQDNYHNPIGFTPLKKARRSSKKKGKNARRKDEKGEKFSSAFDIQRIFDRIHQNEEKQIILKEDRRVQKFQSSKPQIQNNIQDINSQKIASQKISKSSHNKTKNRAVTFDKQGKIADEQDFDDLKEKSKFNKLQSVFQVSGAIGVYGKGRNIMQRVDEEFKDDSQGVPDARKQKQHIKQRKRSRMNLNGAIKMMPLNGEIKYKKKDQNEKFSQANLNKVTKMMNEKDQSESNSSRASHAKKNHVANPNSFAESEKKKGFNIRELLSFKQVSTRNESIQDSLEKIALKEKLKLALYVLMVIVFLNSNLIGSYYIGQKTFSDVSGAILDLATYYHKENYFVNLLFYTLEEFVENKTISFNGSNMAQQYLDLANSNENDYNNLRQSYPVFLNSVSGTLEQLETSQICATVFALNSTKQQSCLTTYDQILQRGLTSAVYSIFTYMQTLQVGFQNNNRTSQFLQERLSDTRFRDMIDFFNEYLHDALVYMSAQVTQSTTQYFDSLSQSYMIVFAVYIGISVVLCFFFGFFVFKKVKEEIMTSINILAIIPLEDLDQRDRMKIETFLNQ